MADMMGLRDPDKKAKPMSPRLLLFGSVLWGIGAALGAVQVARTFDQHKPDYLVLAIFVIFACLFIGYFVAWRRSKRHATEDDEP
jgi:membrane protein DedA with SNARE-associated domain